MRILIIGSGVTGSIYASFLVNSKLKLEKKLKDSVEINILARGDSYKRIKENGLKIKHYLQNIITIDKIPVIETLDSKDKYDYVLIFLRKTQIESLLPVLSANKSEHFVFLGNNGTGTVNYEKSIPLRKIILGFPGVGGSRVDGYISSVHKSKPLITIGSSSNKNRKPVKKLKKILKTAGLQTYTSNNMDSWLKYHIALVSPLAGALFFDGGDNMSLSRNNEALRIMIKAIREGYTALKSLDYPVKPGKLRFMMLFPDFMIKGKLKKMLGSEMGKLVIFDHCQAAPEEMKAIAEEFREIIKKTITKTDNLNRLFSSYIE